MGITLATYVNYITELILSLKTPIILVGHSMAGVVISQVGENIPECIQQLIYINAFVPENNSSLIQEAEQINPLSISTQLAMDHKNNTIIIKKTSVTKKLLFNCCDSKKAQENLALLQNEPLQPFYDKITLSPENFGRLKKLYISCSQDKIIPLIHQQKIYQKIGCPVLTIDTDHSPFFSAPSELVWALLNK